MAEPRDTYTPKVAHLTIACKIPAYDPDDMAAAAAYLDRPLHRKFADWLLHVTRYRRLTKPVAVDYLKLRRS